MTVYRYIAYRQNRQTTQDQVRYIYEDEEHI